MKHITSPWISVAALPLGIGLLLLATATQAQVYRSVGPDGRVTFSDAPPAAQGPSESTRGEASVESGGAALPYELRQTVQRFPVTLYTASPCEPCANGRKLLTERGIPFTEKTVTSTADSTALQRLTGADSLPVLSIGTQQLKGFSAAEWTQYLNAAGYPAQSRLPVRWRPSAPTALAPQTVSPPVGAASSLPPAEASSALSEPAVAPSRTPANPAGIRF